MTDRTPEYARLRSLLEAHGLDANWIQVEGMGPDGYELVRRSERGGPVFVPGTLTLVTDRVPWPKEGLFEQVYELYFGRAYDPELNLPAEAGDPTPVPELAAETTLPSGTPDETVQEAPKPVARKAKA